MGRDILSGLSDPLQQTLIALSTTTGVHLTDSIQSRRHRLAYTNRVVSNLRSFENRHLYPPDTGFRLIYPLDSDLHTPLIPFVVMIG